MSEATPVDGYPNWTARPSKKRKGEKTYHYRVQHHGEDIYIHKQMHRPTRKDRKMQASIAKEMLSKIKRREKKKRKRANHQTRNEAVAEVEEKATAQMMEEEALLQDAIAESEAAKAVVDQKEAEEAAQAKEMEKEAERIKIAVATVKTRFHQEQRELINEAMLTGNATWLQTQAFEIVKLTFRMSRPMSSREMNALFGQCSPFLRTRALTREPNSKCYVYVVHFRFWSPDVEKAIKDILSRTSNGGPLARTVDLYEERRPTPLQPPNARATSNASNASNTAYEAGMNHHAPSASSSSTAASSRPSSSVPSTAASADVGAPPSSDLSREVYVANIPPGARSMDVMLALSDGLRRHNLVPARHSSRPFVNCIVRHGHAFVKCQDARIATACLSLSGMPFHNFCLRIERPNKYEGPRTKCASWKILERQLAPVPLRLPLPLANITSSISSQQNVAATTTRTDLDFTGVDEEILPPDQPVSTRFSRSRVLADINGKVENRKKREREERSKTITTVHIGPSHGSLSSF